MCGTFYALDLLKFIKIDWPDKYLLRQLISKPAEHQHNIHRHAIHDQNLPQSCDFSPNLRKCNKQIQYNSR